MPGPFGPGSPTTDICFPSNVDFGQGIEDSLPYADMAQAPYPLPTAPSMDELKAKYKTTAEDIHRAPSILTFIDLRQ